MTNGYCKVRNCDKLGKKDYKTSYHLPRLTVKGPLTPSQELRLRRRKAWLKALGYKGANSSPEIDKIIVCPRHFVSGKPASFKDVNNVDWVPSLHLGLDDCSSPVKSSVIDLTQDCEHDEKSDKVAMDTKSEVLSDTAEKECASDKVPNVGVTHSGVKRKLPRLKPSPLLAQKMRGKNETDSGEGSEQSSYVIVKDTVKQPTTSEFKKVIESTEANPYNVIQQLRLENQRLLSQNLSLKAKLLETESLYKSLETDHRMSMSKFSDLRYIIDMFTVNEKTFVADEEIVRHFTGLPTYDVLKAMFTHIERFMDTTQYPLTKFQQYILTLMCIRLNIGFHLIAYVFRQSANLVSKIFTRVLQVMHARYKPLVSWPTRANLFQSVPLLFRETFGQHNIVAIAFILELPVAIDSIEVRFEGGGLPEKGSPALVSDYSHPTVVTFVIGLTPQGAVTYVSKSLTKNLSDKELIEKSGLLINLVPEDVVITAKGSTVYEIVENKPDSDAEKKSGCIDRNLLRLRPYELSNAQNISNLRLQVERVTDTFKKVFKYWFTGLPVEFFNVGIDGPAAIDKMIRTSCALNNASLTVVL